MSDPMEVDAPLSDAVTTVSPQDESFLDSLNVPLKSLIVKEDLQDKETSALARADALEIKLRSRLLELTTKLLEDNANNTNYDDELEEYWKSCLDVCIHLVLFSQELYHGMGNTATVRKLPFLLFEDIVETLPLNMVQQIWKHTVECSMDKLFSDRLWIKTSHLVWIRVCNKLLKRLRGGKQQHGEWAGRILLSLASVFPLSERSAMNVLGSFHTDNVTNYESLQEFQAHSNPNNTKEEEEEENDMDDEIIMLQGEKDDESNQKELEKDYAFYETFWSIQKDFSNPNAIDQIPDLARRMQTILAVLETHSFDNKSAAKQSTSSTVGHSSSKYLTNSQLLHLQLRDAELRIHFLTQYLIVESFLASSKSGSSMLLLQQVTKRAKDLMRHTPPHGSRQLQTMEWLLKERESMWKTWKRNKCTPDLEKKAIAQKKKKIMGGTLSNNDKDTTNGQDDYHFVIDVKKDLPQISRDMVNAVPDLHAHLEDYVEALDPEAGIEAEYHPKNNKLYMWRAMRLMSRNHLGLFNKVRRRDGDLEGLVRHVYKTERDTDIPGDGPEAEPFEEFEEERQGMNGQAVLSTDDDVSVGSPMESEAIKEEPGDDADTKASEFAKAALEEEQEMLKQEEDVPKESVKEEAKDSEAFKKEASGEKQEAAAPKKDEETKANTENKASGTSERDSASSKKTEPASDNKAGPSKKAEPASSKREEAAGKKQKEASSSAPSKKEDQSRARNRDAKSSGPTAGPRDADQRGGRGRQGRSPPTHNSPPDRRSPERGRGREDHGRQGRDGGGRARDRHDGGGWDDYRRGRSQDDRGGGGGKRRRHGGGGGRRSY